MIAASRRTFFILFALSGFSGLIYESIWTHYLKLFLGHAAYAQTLVLAIFMGGMALGSWLCSRFSRRWKNLLAGYALAEGAVGILALVFHESFTLFTGLSYDRIIPLLGSPLSVTAWKWGLSTLLIICQTVLLGMTFPLMSAGILRRFPEEPGRSISLLYFSNSMGAVFGVLASGFVMVDLLGLPGTIRTAGLINLALAALVWHLSKSGEAPPLDAAPAQDGARFGGSRWYLFFLLVSLVTGAASFIYEIGWIRMLSLVLGSSTHAFELMLSAFILGLALGGLWIQRRIDRIDDTPRFLGYVQVAMGGLALGTLLVYGGSFSVMGSLVGSIPKSAGGYTLFNLSSHLIAAAIMLPATFCAGMTLPLITYTLLRQGVGERSIGAVYGANTIGAIAGVFFAIHLGLPLLGLKGLLVCGAALDIGLGLVILWRCTPLASRRRTAVTAGAVAYLALVALFVRPDPYKMASGVYRHGQLLTPETGRLFYHRDGKTATISMYLRNDGQVDIRTNGKVDASIAPDLALAPSPDEVTMVLTAAIPLALQPQARTVANIGLGSGLTTHTLLQSPTLERVDTIEIERFMVEGARQFGDRVGLAFNDPRSRIHIDDAKTFFAAHGSVYDIIVSEPSNPWVSGVSGLFSDEFYRLVKRHLATNGLLVQWIQLYEISPDLVMTVLKAVAGNFDDYALYATDDHDLLIVARKQGAVGPLDADVLRQPALAGSLRRVYINGPADIQFRKLGDKQFLAGLLASYPMPANSDYRPVLDQNAARDRFLNRNARRLLYYVHKPLPLVPLLTGEELTDSGSVTLTPFFSKTDALRSALLLRDFFAGSGGQQALAAMPADVREDALLLRTMLMDCAAAMDESTRFAALFNNGVRMLPYLSPAEAAAVWGGLERTPCAGRLTPIERGWIALFRATGKRDGVAMMAATRELLGLVRDPSAVELELLAATGMTGAVMAGQPREALALWQQLGPALSPGGKPDLVFRLLQARAMAP
jgi:spermidine synthase/MFS family permease